MEKGSGKDHVRGWWNIGPHTRIKVDSRDVGDVGRFWYAHAHQRPQKLLRKGMSMPAHLNGLTAAGLLWHSDGQRRFFTQHVFTTDDAVIRFT